jgi:hypothetical protein
VLVVNVSTSLHLFPQSLSLSPPSLCSLGTYGLPLLKNTGRQPPCPTSIGAKGFVLFSGAGTNSVLGSLLPGRNNNSPYLFYCEF